MPSSLSIESRVAAWADESGPASPPRPPLFTLKEINVICWALFAIILLAPIATSITGKIQRGRLLQEERDFVFFYGMGRMLNQYPPSKLYDFELQKKVAMEVLPLKAGQEYSPNPYPPFVGLLFRPFAHFPYSVSYPIWLTFSFSLYIAGLAITANNFFPNDVFRRSLILCFSLSFSPFLWILMGGQISSIGFISLALAFREEDRRRPILSGLALSLCLYKPTLLVLFLPMLLITRRYKTLAGFACGGAVLASLVTGVEGIGVWSGYCRMLLSFGAAAAKVHGYRKLETYIDLPAFASLFPGGRSLLGGGVLVGCACAAIFWLVRSWRRYRGSGRKANMLIWVVTLTWTFVLNLYVPIYDSILEVVGVIATAAILQGSADTRLRRQFTVAWVLIFACSWVALSLAEATGFQVLTALFALLGTVQLIALHRTATEATSDRKDVHASIRLNCDLAITEGT